MEKRDGAFLDLSEYKKIADRDVDPDKVWEYQPRRESVRFNTIEGGSASQPQYL